MNRPNQLTVLRIFLTPFIIHFLFREGKYSLLLASGIFVLATLTDWYDGHFARKYGYVSKWGAFIDPLADKILVSAVLLAFVALGYIKMWMVSIIIIRDVLMMGLRLYSMVAGQRFTTTSIAKLKTFFQYGLVCWILLFMNLETASALTFAPESWFSVSIQHNLINKATLIIALLTAGTGVHYCFENRKQLKIIIWRFYRAILPTDR